MWTIVGEAFHLLIHACEKSQIPNCLHLSTYWPLENITFVYKQEGCGFTGSHV